MCGGPGEHRLSASAEWSGAEYRVSKHDHGGHSAVGLSLIDRVLHAVIHQEFAGFGEVEGKSYEIIECDRGAVVDGVLDGFEGCIGGIVDALVAFVVGEDFASAYLAEVSPMDRGGRHFQDGCCEGVPDFGFYEASAVELCAHVA